MRHQYTNKNKIIREENQDEMAYIDSQQGISGGILYNAIDTPK